MKKKNVIAVVLVVVLVLAILVSLVRCDGGNTVPTDPTEDVTQSTNPTEDTSVTNPSDESTGATNSTEGTNPTENTESTEDSKPTEGTVPTDPTDPTTPKDYVLEINLNSLNLEVGGVGTLSAKYTGNKSLTWSTNNSSVATVSNGKVTAKGVGEAKITVSDGTKSSSCTVKVSKTVKDYTLKISQGTMSLEVGQIGSLTVEYTGTGTIVWESSDTSKATVSNGKVTAKSDGDVVITVTDGVKKSQCRVVVTKKTETPPVEATLNISRSTLNLKVGKSETLSASYNGTKSLTWTSSNTSVATVSNGKVTAKAAGDAVITVTDGVKKSQCKVFVTNDAKPVEVKLSISSSYLDLVVGNTSTLTASYNGTGTLTWSSNKTSVATVSNGKITAKAAGDAIITVSDGTRNAQCRVVVTAPAPAASLKINTADWTIVSVGSTLKVDYTYTGNKSLTWSSSETSILTVDNNGIVTGKSAGSTTVKVTDGELTARVKIEVSDAPKTTSIVKHNYNAPLYDGVVKYAGDYMTLRAETRPYDSNPKVVVTSSNNSVVSVSYEMDYQNITHITLNFKSAGTAKVTITSGDGCYSESYNITVKGDYACNPGSGMLTPEQFVNAYNGVVSANGMSTSVVSGYLVLTLSDSELTWNTARRNAESAFHHWYSVGKSYLSLTYEGKNADGNHVFHVHR